MVIAQSSGSKGLRNYCSTSYTNGMRTHNLGYPRIGSSRELKKTCERYWSGTLSYHELLEAGKAIRRQNWLAQQQAAIDLIPSNDFSYYDHVLDMSLTVGAIPERYHDIAVAQHHAELDLYFAMARGYQKDGFDVIAMEMTKWFDTNYHYIVPEFSKNQRFRLFSTKIINEYYEARELGIHTKPVLLGPVSYLLLGKEKEAGFHRLDLLPALLPVYIELLEQLEQRGATWIQFDEPFLALDCTDKELRAFQYVYKEIRKRFPALNILLATYFEGLAENTELAVSLPVTALHIDVVRCPEQLHTVLEQLPSERSLSLGIVDGRNIWKNDFRASLAIIEQAVSALGSERVLLAPSCSLLHSPCDIELETNERVLSSTVKHWMAFARQKIDEVVALARLANPATKPSFEHVYSANQQAMESRRTSALIHNPAVQARVQAMDDNLARRNSAFPERKRAQQEKLQLPLFPTTTIGSFPQTAEVRSWRAQWKKGVLSHEAYDTLLRKEIASTIRWQEDIGIDVLVHGEFERNDMVEYFGEQLEGVAFTHNGWVQSYGSRCVKPPVIFGDVSRPHPMTVAYSAYAQSLTTAPVKGMLTGPVTVLQWSFVRDDQPRSTTCVQIALAIRDEVCDLEQAGIGVIQIDEPAIREGLPLRLHNRQAYLHWAVQAFRIASSGVRDETQIHTHMCYSEFNDIIADIAAMDADVITIETSRSQMELLEAFAEFHYPNDIGPGVYDIHSPRVPSRGEMEALLEKAKDVVPANQLWVNPDCGLKTRGWDETRAALLAMVDAARTLRELETATV